MMSGKKPDDWPQRVAAMNAAAGGYSPFSYERCDDNAPQPFMMMIGLPIVTATKKKPAIARAKLICDFTAQAFVVANRSAPNYIIDSIRIGNAEQIMTSVPASMLSQDAESARAYYGRDDSLRYHAKAESEIVVRVRLACSRIKQRLSIQRRAKQRRVVFQPAKNVYGRGPFISSIRGMGLRKKP